MWEPLLSVPSHPPLSCASNVPLSPLPFKHLPSELTESSQHKQRFIAYLTKATEFIETQMAEPSKTLSHACFWTWGTGSCLFYIPMENGQTAIYIFIDHPLFATLHNTAYSYYNKLTKLCSGQISSWRPMMSKHYTLRIFKVLSLNKLTVPRNNKEVQ